MCLGQRSGSHRFNILLDCYDLVLESNVELLSRTRLGLCLCLGMQDGNLCSAVRVKISSGLSVFVCVYVHAQM